MRITRASCCFAAVVLLLLVAQVLDVVSTHAVLAQGGREANPLVAPLFAQGALLRVVLAKVVMVAGVTAFAWLLRQISLLFALWFIGALTAVSLAIVFWNVTQI